MTGRVEIAPVTGAALADALPALARLRIEVFRAFPYLYDGDEDYEHDYLRTFSQAEGAIIVVACDGDRVVGAATGAPMREQMAEWSHPFAALGYDLAEIFYCGESVLLPEYRGQGIGHAFFDHREARARELGARLCCFCGVIRPADHPLRPAGYRPLDGFWRKRGYQPLEGVQAEFAWKDVDRPEETTKRLQFWMREL